jgi:hypothetical protein
MEARIKPKVASDVSTENFDTFEEERGDDDGASPAACKPFPSFHL